MPQDNPARGIQLIVVTVAKLQKYRKTVSQNLPDKNCHQLTQIPSVALAADSNTPFSITVWLPVMR